MRMENFKPDVLKVNIYPVNGKVTNPIILSSDAKPVYLQIRSKNLIEKIVIETLNGEFISECEIRDNNYRLDCMANRKEMCLIRFIFSYQLIPYIIVVI